MGTSGEDHNGLDCDAKVGTWKTNMECVAEWLALLLRSWEVLCSLLVCRLDILAGFSGIPQVNLSKCQYFPFIFGHDYFLLYTLQFTSCPIT